MDNYIKEEYNLQDLLQIISTLRSEHGCPWDREQTHTSIRQNFIEETYEAVEAIDNGDTALLREELGDVLLQILLHCQMEAEVSGFDFFDIVDELAKKLVVRHPHVFGNKNARNSQEALNNWDAAKRQQKAQTKRSEALTSVARSLPALMRAEKIQGRSAKFGFGYSNAEEAISDLESEIEELKIAINCKNATEIRQEMGDLLFSAGNVAKCIDVSPEEALYLSTDKFVNRVIKCENFAEADCYDDLKNVPKDVLHTYWQRAKDIIV